MIRYIITCIESARRPAATSLWGNSFCGAEMKEGCPQPIRMLSKNTRWRTTCHYLSSNRFAL
eukprot:5266977-Amphidinium_carterae.1